MNAMERPSPSSPPTQPAHSSHSVVLQVLLSLGVLGVAALLAYGATQIPSEAGYAGIGPNFLPWVVAAALLVCGGLLLRQALTGGFQDLDEASGAPRADWHAWAWVSAGVLANASLIEHIGFVLSCALCFTLAVRGLRIAEGKPGGGWMGLLRDAAIGLLLAAPVYWLFAQLLAVNLPSLTATGWI
ncbi:MAG: tripartite tricarboxylate transporter TctB family protein [Betaproteobacteria bacterium]|uniref:DUF1468 domain-containing protein n=2 Tax=Serpentinimonas maccroryi TaxID=1458426 RepID=A0A060NMR7_9BURK|nr:tripartite tricarboxylate transporter TctB family protein [Serpentinimonas maccroryi]MCL5968848.1 tripartite tricarboxylate transporter TctB family protein [Betaproteobacteria bacterium]BAO83077.1 hypothetical protein SMCB_0849 [Serpentinimonas maccroryi]